MTLTRSPDIQEAVDFYNTAIIAEHLWWRHKHPPQRAREHLRAMAAAYKKAASLAAAVRDDSLWSYYLNRSGVLKDAIGAALPLADLAKRLSELADKTRAPKGRSTGPTPNIAFNGLVKALADAWRLQTGKVATVSAPNSRHNAAGSVPVSPFVEFVRAVAKDHDLQLGEQESGFHARVRAALNGSR